MNRPTGESQAHAAEAFEALEQRHEYVLSFLRVLVTSPILREHHRVQVRAVLDEDAAGFPRGLAPVVAAGEEVPT